MLDKLKSRKFWITLLTQISIVLLVMFFDLPEETATQVVTAIAGIAGAYVLGQGYADGQKELAKKG